MGNSVNGSWGGTTPTGTPLVDSIHDFVAQPSKAYGIRLPIPSGGPPKTVDHLGGPVANAELPALLTPFPDTNTWQMRQWNNGTPIVLAPGYKNQDFTTIKFDGETAGVELFSPPKLYGPNGPVYNFTATAAGAQQMYFRLYNHPNLFSGFASVFVPDPLDAGGINLVGGRGQVVYDWTVFQKAVSVVKNDVGSTVASGSVQNDVRDADAFSFNNSSSYGNTSLLTWVVEKRFGSNWAATTIGVDYTITQGPALPATGLITISFTSPVSGDPPIQYRVRNQVVGASSGQSGSNQDSWTQEFFVIGTDTESVTVFETVYPLVVANSSFSSSPNNVITSAVEPFEAIQLAEVELVGSLDKLTPNARKVATVTLTDVTDPQSPVFISTTTTTLLDSNTSDADWLVEIDSAGLIRAFVVTDSVIGRGLDGLGPHLFSLGEGEHRLGYAIVDRSNVLSVFQEIANAINEL